MATNGVMSPPPPSHALANTSPLHSAKRKRCESHDLADTMSGASTTTSATKRATPQEEVNDLLEVLRR